MHTDPVKYMLKWQHRNIPGVFFMRKNPSSNETKCIHINHVSEMVAILLGRFLETVELQISLKNYDPQKDKRFSGTVRFGHSSVSPRLLPAHPSPAHGCVGAGSWCTLTRVYVNLRPGMGSAEELWVA